MKVVYLITTTSNAKVWGKVTINSKKTDDIVWEKVCAAIKKPEYLFSQAKSMGNNCGK